MKTNLLIMLLFFCSSFIPPKKLKQHNRLTLDYKEYRKLKPNLGFKQIYSDPSFNNLDMLETPGKFGVEGNYAKLLRALRFKNITDVVEDRYNLPRYTILAMVIKESNGIDLMPNGRGDGGFGLSHMQPIIAKDFNLKTYKNCSAMVCNGKDKRSCRGKNSIKLNHALELENLIKTKSYDRKNVYSYDDRLHPILNLDAVGRMLACYMDGPQIKGLGPLRTAICRYAGRYNYKKYWTSVLHYVDLLEDKKFMVNLEVKFNEVNGNLTINGRKGNFKMYIEVSEQQNLNYGLEEYKKLQKYNPKNSEIVKKTYRNFIK